MQTSEYGQYLSRETQYGQRLGKAMCHWNHAALWQVYKHYHPFRGRKQHFGVWTKQELPGIWKQCVDVCQAKHNIVGQDVNAIQLWYTYGANVLLSRGIPLLTHLISWLFIHVIYSYTTAYLKHSNGCVWSLICFSMNTLAIKLRHVFWFSCYDWKVHSSNRQISYALFIT